MSFNDQAAYLLFVLLGNLAVLLVGSVWVFTRPTRWLQKFAIFAAFLFLATLVFILGANIELNTATVTVFVLMPAAVCTFCTIKFS